MSSTAKLWARAARRAKASEYAIEAEAEEGFTLIELMVVLLIMAILLAIAIPTFLGVTSSAHNRAAQSDLRNAFDTAQTIYQSQQEYITAGTTTGPLMTTAMKSSEPGLVFTTGAVSPNTNQVSVDVVGPNAIVLAAATSGQRCWFLANAETSTAASELGVPNAGTYYGLQTSDGGTCEASAYTGVTLQPNKFPAG
jgi:type IV pilus assembly protein PilA